MKKLITAATLILAANSASAIGFSPWTDADAAAATQSETAYVEAAGFAPWRDREVAADAIQVKSTTGVAVTQGQRNVFRPWS